MKVHVVLEDEATAVVRAINRLGQVTDWDRSLDAAVQWAQSGRPPDPEVIIAKATVSVSLVDPGTGARLERKAAVLEALRKIRLARPRTRMVLLLPSDYQKEVLFLQRLVALGIYDFHFVSQFDREDLERWLTTANTLADVQAYLPEQETAPPESFSGPEGTPGRAGRNGRSAMRKELLPAKHGERLSARGTPPLSVPLSGPLLGTRVLVVAGLAPRVGSTAFALSLAACLRASGRAVEILDAGGGAFAWLRGNCSFCRKVPPLSVVPGIVTVVDAGTALPEELMPVAEALFLVTDLSCRALPVQPALGACTYLVGNRGAPLPALKELAGLWQIPALFTLPETQEVRNAELSGELPRPRSWRKLLAFSVSRT